MVGGKKSSRAKDTVTREYTINLHKKLHGTNFKKRAPLAVKQIRIFAKKMMGTNDVRLDVKLNKVVWSRVSAADSEQNFLSTCSTFLKAELQLQGERLSSCSQLPQQRLGRRRRPPQPHSKLYSRWQPGARAAASSAARGGQRAATLAGMAACTSAQLCLWPSPALSQRQSHHGAKPAGGRLAESNTAVLHVLLSEQDSDVSFCACCRASGMCRRGCGSRSHGGATTTRMPRCSFLLVAIKWESELCSFDWVFFQ